MKAVQALAAMKNASAVATLGGA